MTASGRQLLVDGPLRVVDVLFAEMEQQPPVDRPPALSNVERWDYYE
jgi:hypothetical protein